MTERNLNSGQKAAYDAIIDAVQNRHSIMRPDDITSNSWLLLGEAGTGKTYVTCCIVDALKQLPRYNNSDRKLRVAVCAPTHKAAQVLTRKLREFGVNAVAITIHSLLGLKPTVDDSEKQVLKKQSKGFAGDFDVVVLDETSMVDTPLQGYIDRELEFHFILYVGDDGQLNPVGEKIAPIFARMPEHRTSRLTEIVRQAAENPIIQVAGIIRRQQNNGRDVDWSWVRPIEAGNKGVFIPPANQIDDWLKEGFTSREFKEDNDFFRYVCYTNETVHRINAKCRQWIYGETDTPFVPGERVICRNPVQNEEGATAFATNQEAIVNEIYRDERKFSFIELPADPYSGKAHLPAFEVTMPIWRVRLVASADMVGETDDEGAPYGVPCIMPVDRQAMMRLDRHLCSQAKANRDRWRQRFAWLELMADLRPVYGLTGHSAQGSTFVMGAVDIPDIAKLAMRNPEEAKKLAYVCLTRFSDAVIIAGGR